LQVLYHENIRDGGCHILYTNLYSTVMLKRTSENGLARSHVEVSSVISPNNTIVRRIPYYITSESAINASRILKQYQTIYTRTQKEHFHASRVQVANGDESINII